MPEPAARPPTDAERILAVFAAARSEGRSMASNELDRIERHQMEDVWLTVQDDPWWEPS